MSEFDLGPIEAPVTEISFGSFEVVGFPGPPGDIGPEGPQGPPGLSTLWDGGPDVATFESAADLRAAIEVLTEEEVEEIFAAAVHTHAISDVTGLQTALDGKAAASHTHAIGDVTGLQSGLEARPVASGTRTSGALTRYDASGQLVVSRVRESNTSLFASSPDGQSYFYISNSEAILSSGNDAYFIGSTALYNAIYGRTFIGTLLTGNPARMFEIRDSAAAQLRLTHTAGTHWADLRAMSGGTLRVNSSAGASNFDILCATNVTLTSSTGLTFETASISAKFRFNSASYLEANSTAVLVGTASKWLLLHASEISLFGAIPVGQCAPIANPTDAASTQAALISLLDYLRSRGDIAT